MAGTTVRITTETHEILRKLAATDGLPMQEVLARAVETYRRQQILRESNAGYAALQADPEAWQQELYERGAWDATLLDGVEPQ